MVSKRVSPAVLLSLREALACAFWYRGQLRSFVTSCLGDQGIVARIDWNGQYKRASIDQLVSHLASNQHRTFDELLSLVLATADIDDPQHLRRLDDGERKYEEALAALRRLKAQAEPLRGWRDEREQAARRRDQERERSRARRALTEQMSGLREEFQALVMLAPQPRGYAFEGFLTRLFEAFDIEAKGPFRLEGEQIDGAFTFQGNEFLVEAKWQDPLTRRADLDVFAQKIGRKLDNTLGLFVSVNGYEPTAVAAHSGVRPNMILMDGGDLMAVLDERLELPALLLRKRQHAARTGEVFIPAVRLLS